MSKEEDKISSAFHMFLETSLKDQWHPSLSYLLWLLACCCCLEDGFECHQQGWHDKVWNFSVISVWAM